MSDLYIFGPTPPEKIDISNAAVNLVASNFVYDGTEKTQNVASVYVRGVLLTAGTDYIVSGNTATNSGTHTLSVIGIGNYGGIVQKNWRIYTQASTISASPSSLSVIGIVGTTATSTITASGDGTLSAQSSNTNVATVSVSGTTVTVISVSAGSATITVSISDGINYAGNNTTITVNVTTPSNILAENSPEMIQVVAQASMGPNFWSVGDKTSEISISAFSGISATSACAFILGFNHNSNKEGNGIHFQFGKTTDGTDICFYSLAMNNSNSNSGGWNGSVMRTTHCPAFLAALPSEWQAVIADCDKYSDNTGGGSDTASYVTKTTDKIFLLAEWEVFGARTYANSAEQNYQAQYAYYTNGNSKIKYQHTNTGSTGHWWLRSVRASNSNSFCVVNAGGSATSGSANNTLGFAPGFKMA